MSETDALRDDGGPRWGFMSDGRFIPLPKQPLLLAGFTKPPFDVVLPTGFTRHVIEEPDG